MKYKKYESGSLIFNENAIDVLDLMIEKGIKVDCVITDPPYKLTSRGTSGSMGGEFWKGDLAKKGKVFKEGTVEIEDWLKKCYDVLNDGTHIYIMTNDKNITDYLNAIKESQFKFVKTLTWVKPNKICGRWYMTQKETIILARKGKSRPINNAGTSDVLFTPDFKKLKDGKSNLHNTEKPTELMKIFIENSTNEGEKVFDPFSGIFSTCIAAKETERRFIGVELDTNYFNIGIDRLGAE